MINQIPKILSELTFELCNISSVTKYEAELSAEIFSRCQTLGDLFRVQKIGNAIVVDGPVIPHRPTIALLGHLDTVPPSQNQKKGIFWEEGRVYGCGASDMKGGLAIMLALLQEADMFQKANIRCVFYDKEEGPISENGLTPLLHQGVLSGVHFGICLEPTDNQIQAGCLGGLQATVTFMGRRAHSARPWQGENAIYKAIPFLQRLKDFGKREVWVKGLPFYEVMNPTLAQAGIARNVIPDQFVLNINCRFAPSRSVEEVLKELQALLQGEGEIHITDQSPSGDVWGDHSLIKPWKEQLGLEVVAKQAWTDVAQLTQQGIPAINFGPGDTNQAHQENESISISSMEKNYQSLKSLFL